MKQRMIDAGGSRTYIVILETGEEVAASLKRLAEENHLAGSSFKAIGALSHAKVGWFNWQTKKYEIAAQLDEQLEVLSLIGDVALQDGKPVVHAHLIVGRSDGTAHGGHLLEAHVRPTLEVVLTESAQPLQKVSDPESGIALIRP
jgi:predicted DNA-binding protein with PD1-like motif